MDDANRHAPDLEIIHALALSARANLPAPWAELAKPVAFRIEDFAPPEMLADLEMANPFELTGLYDGIPLTQKSVMDQPDGPDTVWLFRRAILDEWVDRGNVSLAELVTHIVVHELAHHFGWTDEDIARVDRWWE